MDSDSDDSILAMNVGLSRRKTRGSRRTPSTPGLDMKSVMNDANDSLNRKQGSVTKMNAANRENGEVLDDVLIEEIRALSYSAQKLNHSEEEAPEGYDGTFSAEEHKEIMECIELQGSYAVKGLEGTLLFECVEELFFKSIDQCIQQLRESLTEETELQKKLRLSIENNLLLHFLASARFRELCKSDSTAFMSEWLVKVGCSAGLDNLQELGLVARQLLIQDSVVSLNLSSSSLKGRLSCWTLSDTTSSTCGKTGDVSNNKIGLKNMISIYEHSLESAEVEEGKDCIRRLVQLGLTTCCRVGPLMGRIVSTAHMTSVSEPWVESFCNSLLSDASTWGSRSSPAAAWLAMSKVTKLFPLTADNLAFAAKLTEHAIEKCLSGSSVDAENASPGAEKLYQGQHPKAFNTILSSFLGISVHLEVFSNSPAQCQASLDCITHLFRIGLLQLGSDSDKEVSVLVPFIKLVMPHAEKIMKEISRKSTHAEFQRCELLLRYLLRYWKDVRQRAEEKFETSPRTQAKLSAFFSPST